MRTILPTLLLFSVHFACSGAATQSESESATSESTATATATMTSTSTNTAETGSATDSSSSTGTGTDTAPAANGEACSANLDCASRCCLKFRDHDPAAVCVAAAEDGVFRLTGTVLDLSAAVPLSAAEVRVLDGLTALQNPSEAPILLAATSDPDGVVDQLSEELIPGGIGLVALVVGDGLATTSNQLALPLVNGTYGPINTFRDLWAVPQAQLDLWNTLLLADPALAPHVPLGSAGGVLGIVRDASSATTLQGASVISEKDSSTAFVRYLSETRDSFVGEDGGEDGVTASHGIFVILNPGVAEGFTLEIDGTSLDVRGEARSTPNTIATMILEAP